MTDFPSFRESHDPNGRKDWTFQWQLSTGESISTATVEVVDTSSTDVDASTDLVIESTAWGLAYGTTHGVTVWISGGTAGRDYPLRCRITTSNTPLSRKDDMTIVLKCRQG